MLSARAGEEARVEGLTAGAEDYLVKPFSARELLARVRTHLELARLRKEIQARQDYLFSLLHAGAGGDLPSSAGRSWSSRWRTSST